MSSVFTVRYCDRENGAWEDVFPGLTGDYKWAQKIAASTWNCDGQPITPEMMQIFKCEGCENCLYESIRELCPGGCKALSKKTPQKG